MLKNIYAYGTEYVSMMKGYDYVAYGGSNIYTEGAGSITLTARYYGEFAEVATSTGVTVDLTDYKTLWVDWAAGNPNGGVGVYALVVHSSFGNSLETYTARYSAQLTGTSGTPVYLDRCTNSLDVSALSGNHYISVHSRKSTGGWWDSMAVEVYRIWLSKL